MKIVFQVTGMTCAACSARVEKVTRQVDGVLQADVNLLAGTMVVESNDDSVISTISEAVSKSGYQAFIAGEKQKKQEKLYWECFILWQIITLKKTCFLM